MNLVVVEMRRALHRRVVYVLIGLALVGCLLAGLISFFDSAGKSLAELHANGEPHPAVMRDWWISGGGDGALMISFFFLLIGGLFGGASVAGAEWRSGTVTTVLTWEPRRWRLHLSRAAACCILSAAIAFLLQVVFLAALLPAVLTHGSTGNLDGAWWTSLLLAMMRASLVTSIATLLGVSLATAARSTAFAIVSVFLWVAVIEGMIRGLKPGLAQYLWGENIAIALPWAQIDHVSYVRGPLVALTTIALYTAIIAVVASLSFVRRDVASAT
jgi:hypothetical protein